MDRTGSMLLMGLTCVAISANTSVITQQFNDVAGLYSAVDGSYGNESNSLQNYPIPRRELKVETEAKELFGNMREATIAERKSIQNSIDKISLKTGFNFWD